MSVRTHPCTDTTLVSSHCFCAVSRLKCTSINTALPVPRSRPISVAAAACSAPSSSVSSECRSGNTSACRQWMRMSACMEAPCDTSARCSVLAAELRTSARGSTDISLSRAKTWQSNMSRLLRLRKSDGSEASCLASAA